MFLTDEQIAELTGIKRGVSGKRREELQCEHLRKVGIPFFPNARGKPMVVAEALIGTRHHAQESQSKAKWTPKVLNRD